MPGAEEFESAGMEARCGHLSGSLFAVTLTLAIKMPAAADSGDHADENQDRHDRKCGTASIARLMETGFFNPCRGVRLGGHADVGRSLVRSLQVVGDRLFFIDAYVLGVAANITFVEDAAGEKIELLLLERAQQACADLGGGGYLVERMPLISRSRRRRSPNRPTRASLCSKDWSN